MLQGVAVHQNTYDQQNERVPKPHFPLMDSTHAQEIVFPVGVFGHEKILWTGSDEGKPFPKFSCMVLPPHPNDPGQKTNFLN
jgi:hypothetical protein